MATGVVEPERGLEQGAIPEHFKCPITLEVMRDPVIDNEGVSYERAAIVEWLSKGSSTSPATGKHLEQSHLRPNLALKETIEKHCGRGTKSGPEATSDEGASASGHASPSQAPDWTKDSEPKKDGEPSKDSSDPAGEADGSSQPGPDAAGTPATSATSAAVPSPPPPTAIPAQATQAQTSSSNRGERARGMRERISSGASWLFGRKKANNPPTQQASDSSPAPAPPTNTTGQADETELEANQPPPNSPPGGHTSLDDVTLGLKGVYWEGSLMVNVEPPTSQHPVRSKVCCVVDVSGSMDTEAMIQNEEGVKEGFGLSVLDIVKHALRTVIHSLSDQDMMAIVTFSSTSQIVLEATFMTDENKKKAERIVGDLRTEGMTNLWAGLEMGMDLVTELNPKKPATLNSAVLLLTDGCPNVSPSRGEDWAMKEYVKRQKGGRLPARLHTFGFGYSMDSLMLSKLADIGGGNYCFIPDGSFVGTIFVSALANHILSAASNLKLTITANDGAVFQKGEHSWHRGKFDAHEVEIIYGCCQFGQSKNVVISMKGVREADVSKQLKLSLTYFTGASQKEALGEVQVDKESSEDIKYHSARQLLFAGMFEALEEQDLVSKRSPSESDLKKATEKLKEADKKMKKILGSDDRSKDLLKDLNGQITEALSKQEFYKKWGKHYVLSIRGAHVQQICNNFKDPGIQHYTSDLFESTRSRLDSIFIKLPAPTPSCRPSYNYGRMSGSGSRSGSGSVITLASTPQDSMVTASRARRAVNMSRFHNAAGPCFHGNCSVQLASRKTIQVKDVKKGDKLICGDGSFVDTVQCMVKTKLDQQAKKFCVLGENLLITPWHPVKTHGEWKFPAEMENVADIDVACDAVYSLLMANRSTVRVGGFECASLAHGLRGHVIQHDFLGTEAVTNDLAKFEGYGSGLVELTMGCIERNAKNGVISGFKTF